MLPLNSLSTQAIQGAYLYPYAVVRSSLVEDFQIGGIGLQNPSQGHQTDLWYGYWDTGTNSAYVRKGIGGTDIFLHTESNVFEFAFTFDQNMRWVTMVTLTDGTSKFRWYDSSVAAYVTTVYTGIASVRLVLDDTRFLQLQTGATDVIMTYIKLATNELCFRAQRDRYLIEYILYSPLSANLLISNFGMHNRLRLQWRFRYRIFSEILPWLP